MWLLLFLGIFLPGFFIASCFIRTKFVPLLAVPTALFIYVCLAAGFILIEQTQWLFPSYLLVGSVALVIVFSISRTRTQLLCAARYIRHFIPLAIVLVAYHTLVGAFVDHGSDVFRHMTFTRKVFNIAVDNAGELGLYLKTGTQNFFFYNIAAYFAQKTNLFGPPLLESISLTYSILWTFSVYFFCYYTFELIGLNGRHRIFYAYLAVALYWLTFGINNFSFPRYYIGGPGILNYGVFLAAIALFLDQLRNRVTTPRLLLIGCLTGVAVVLHEQEAILIFTYAFTISTVVVIYSVVKKSNTIDIPINKQNFNICLGVCVLSIGAILSAIVLLPKYAFDPIRLLNLGIISERLIGWNILRPSHQFYTVLGLWGIYVLCLAVVFVKDSVRSIIVISTLVLPLITVFNPIFAEAFMKLAYPNVLWRLLFAMQLPIVATYFLWSVQSRWRDLHTIQKGMHFVILIPLLVLPFSFQLGPIKNTMTKTPSLITTPSENSYKHWQDLIDFLNSVETRHLVLADPVTGYAIRSLTPHRHVGIKFFRKHFDEYNFDSYGDHPLKIYKGRLLVINLRNGEINYRLQPPYHIYPDIMKVAKYYGEPLLRELEINSHRYSLIWQNQDISVYKIL